ncbi:MAG: MgtC/SapB family protein, partial [Phycisphaerales bacterium]|nr:MgtC/SapB family protein [Phycisphaerales bacterium]
MEQLELVLRLIAAMILGAALGAERERGNKSAGLRTLTLVSLGAALYAVLGEQIVKGGGGGQGGEPDPTRIVAGLVGGVGFLGAGAIFQARGNVKGLTTAAGIWMTAAIGVGCGLGEYVLATAGTLLALVTLVGLTPLERAINGKSRRDQKRDFAEGDEDEGGPVGEGGAGH